MIGVVRLRSSFFVSVQKVVIEIKILRGSRETLVAEGLEQTAAYADACNAAEAHLVIFDRDPDRRWEEMICYAEALHAGRIIGVWGL